MNGRTDRQPRHGKSSLAFAVAASLALAGCKNGGEGESRPIEFTPGAMRSLPSLKAGASPTSPAALTSARPSASTIGDYFFVAQLFEMQCRHPDGGGVNYCPPGTPPPPTGTFDPYQFTMQALIGFIFHAQMYTSLVTDCSGDNFTPKSVTAGSYAAASAAPGANPTRFVLDQFSTYTCRASNVSDANAETRMVSAVADGSYQTTLHTRYQYRAGGDPQTDLFQVDVSMEAGAPTFLALNFASGAPFRSRIVLLANLASHRFALKYYTPTQPGNLGLSWPPEHYAVAVGVGGYDLTTGAPNPGHYYVDFLDEPIYPVIKRCADNAGGVMQADFTACTGEGVPTAWTSSDSIQAYLAVPAAHAARLAPYLSQFQGAATLGAADAWQNLGDEDLYWPASLH
jgi:hypothetical protein